MGLPPGQQSDGHYQRQLDSLFPARPEHLQFYPVQVLAKTAAGVNRASTTIHVVPPHESLNAEIAKSREGGADIMVSLQASDWEPAYRMHPTVVEAQLKGRQLPYPVAFYIDGVNFTKQIAPGRQDSLICFVMYNLVTNKRHLICSVRKSRLCKCGCSGWDSLFPIFKMLSWSCKAMAEGRRPPRRHDGSPWGDDEVWGRLQEVCPSQS